MSADRLTLQSLFSPAFPTGGFAYSHGLEALVAEGRVRDAAALSDWLGTVLGSGAGWTDAVLFAAAARGMAPAALDELARALAGSAGRRRETCDQGAAFAAACRAVHGIDLPDMAWPVAAGRAVHLLGLEPEAALAAALLGVATALVGAGQRLVPVGQVEGQRVIAALVPLCADLARRASDADPDEIGGFAPLVDVACARQETLSTRLFRS
ncbi:urease accessory protein UreF [Roseivivax isoporae]|uniref:Urease accessory protein UreF n=1 Tax=Roseivivax isoporae LMG 25204 TaxID=1449351 RepID=X7FDM3_9RHOB|nr:urease accessory UreF family protein [Roseivivax isoporae]ETX30171.1 urease accessory protein UreF [Roseivivax isoporae LMG 25204]